MLTAVHFTTFCYAASAAMLGLINVIKNTVSLIRDVFDE